MATKYDVLYTVGLSETDIQKAKKRASEVKQELQSIANIGKTTNATSASYVNNITNQLKNQANINNNIINQQRIQNTNATKALKTEQEKIIAIKAQLANFKTMQERNISTLQTGKFGGFVDEQSISRFRTELASLNHETPNLNARMAELRGNFSQIQTDARLSSHGIRGMADEMTNATGKLLLWTGATTLLFGTFRSFQEGIETIKELDSAMLELKKTTDETDLTYKRFAEDSFAVGQALGRTGTEVINATSNFTKMGYSLNEALELGEASLTLLNVSDGIKDVDEATGDIIATMKGFDLQANEVNRILDVINEVSNTSAVSSKDLADGFKRVAGVMKQSGDDMEHTAGMLTGINMAMQNMPKSATALKTVSLRLKGMDENEEAIDGLIPKMQDMFNQIGVEMTDANGQILTTYEIMKQLAGVFESGALSKNQIADITETLGGKWHASAVASLLSNWKDVDKAVLSAQNSIGSAKKEQEKYLDSINGRLQILSSSVERFWNAFISSEGFKTSITIFTSLIDNLTWLTETIGSLNTVLLITIGLIGAFKPAMIMPIITSIQGMAGAVVGLEVSLGALALTTGGIVIALGLLAKAVDYYVNLNEKRIESVQKNITATEQEAEEYNNLIDSYNKLKNASDEKLESDKDLLKIQKDLADQYPELISYVDEEGNTYVRNIDKLKDYTQAKKELMLESLKLQRDTLGTGYESDKERIEELNNMIAEQSKSTGSMTADTILAYKKERLAVMDRVNSYEDLGKAIKKIEDSVIFAGKEQFLTGTDIITQAYEKIYGKKNNEKEYKSYTGKSETTGTQAYISELETRYMLLDQAIRKTKTEISDLGKTMDSLPDDEKIKALEKQRDLYLQMQQYLSAYADTLRTERSEVSDSLQAFGFSIDIVDDEAYIRNLDNIKTLTGDNAKEAETLIKRLTELDTKIDSTGSEWLDYGEKLEDIKEAHKEIVESWEKDVSDMAKTIAGFYEDYYKKKKEEVIDSIKDELEAEKDRHDEVIDNLDDELDKYNDIIDAKLKSLEATKDESDYNSQINKLTKEKEEIQKKINVLSIDNSIEAKAQKEELSQELADIEEQILETRNNREYDLRKENLEYLKDNYKDEVDEKKEIENEKYETLVNNLNEELDYYDTYYDKLIDKEENYNKIRRDIINNNLNDIKSDLESFSDSVSGINVAGISSDLDKIVSSKPSDTSESVSDSTYDKDLATRLAKDAGRVGFDVFSGALFPNPTSSQQEARNYLDETYSGGVEAYAKNQAKRFKELDIYHNGGIVGGTTFNPTTEVIAKLAKGEVVLNNEQQDRMLDLINGLSTSTSNNINIYVDKLQGGKEGANELFSILNNELKIKKGINFG